MSGAVNISEQTSANARAKLPAPVGGPRRRPGSVLAPMLLAGLLCGLGAYLVIRDRDVSYRVAVAARDLRPGAVLGSDAFAFADVQTSADLAATLLHAGRIGEVRGWVAANRIAAGELVSVGDLRPPSAPARTRAMSLPIDRERAVAGDLSEGDQVDVIAIVDGAARYVASGLQVLAVGERAGPAPALAGLGRFTVTVAVDDRAALALLAALDTDTVQILRSTGAAPASTLPLATGGASAGVDPPLPEQRAGARR